MKNANVLHTNAKYEVLATYNNVLVKIPDENDKELKFTFAHLFSNGDKDVVRVPCHLRRGLIINGEMLTRRFYIIHEFIGQTIVADEVRLVAKYEPVHDGFFKFYQYTLIIDIIVKNTQKKKPRYILKCGTTKKSGFIIPRTNRFVNFEKY